MATAVTAEALKRFHLQRRVSTDAKATLFLDGYTLNVEIRRFTPYESLDILTNFNSSNRPKDKVIIERYARLMAMGHWLLNGETIIFGRSGNVITGQHRLEACVRSNTPFYSLVVTDVDDTVFTSCDRGKSKTVSQILQLAKEPNSKQLCGTINYIVAYKAGRIAITNGSLQSNVRLEPSEMMDFVAANPDIRVSVTLGKTIAVTLSQPSMLAAAHFIFSEIAAAQAQEFMDKLKTGDSLTAGHPVLTLRNRIMANNVSRLKERGEVLFAMTIKAWNAYRHGVDLKRITISANERFPRAI
jgi:hypothetical protein